MRTPSFHPAAAPAAVTATIENVAMLLGEAFVGGGIVNNGHLTLIDCLVSNCRATGDGGVGGGLHTAEPRTSYILRGCTITGNHAPHGSPDIRQISSASHVAFLGDNVVGDASNLVRWASTPSDQIGTMAAAPAAPASQADNRTDDLAGNEPHDQTD